MRTDTERLDWMLAAKPMINLNIYGARASIDAAMDAEEGKELEEAWKMFQQREWALYSYKAGTRWLVWSDGGSYPAETAPSRNAAILSAYRAAKKGEGSR